MDEAPGTTRDPISTAFNWRGQSMQVKLRPWLGLGLGRQPRWRAAHLQLPNPNPNPTLTRAAG